MVLTRTYINNIKAASLRELKRLGVSTITVGALEISSSIPKSIAVCAFVSEIVSEFRSDEATEKKVAGILERFLELHFMSAVIEE